MITGRVICSKRLFLDFTKTCRKISYTENEIAIQDAYMVLNLPREAKQREVRAAFLELAKKYHPDSGSPEADVTKFVEIENAFRTLSTHNTGSSRNEEIEKIVYDIQHTAPQHRQYLSFEGVGSGTPSQREKQWIQHRAQRAANNVTEHRIAKSVASENTLMKKGDYKKKHDIKTKYGFDRLVEDLIQESMSKGEFENLSGKGKPLKDQNTNPYVDFTTHKLNEVLINNGFMPEWITMNKEIDEDIEALKKEIRSDRSKFGPYPFTPEEEDRWSKICVELENLSKSINNKITTYNLIVPLLNKQRFHIDFNKIKDDILQNGAHSLLQDGDDKNKITTPQNSPVQTESDDLFSYIFKAFNEIFNNNQSDKKSMTNRNDKHL